MYKKYTKEGEIVFGLSIETNMYKSKNMKSKNIHTTSLTLSHSRLHHNHPHSNNKMQHYALVEYPYNTIHSNHQYPLPQLHYNTPNSIFPTLCQPKYSIRQSTHKLIIYHLRDQTHS